MTLRRWLAAAAVWLGATATAAAQDAVAWATDDGDGGWDQASSLLAPEETLRRDDQFRLAQAASQQSSNRSSAYRTASRGARSSRMPYMIGDSPSAPGYTYGVAFGGVPISALEHPYFGGNRFNVAENNSATPGDRVFATYRHFHNADDVDALGYTSSLDIERFDLGFEKSALDGLVSAQLVVPLLRQFGSDVLLYSDPFGNNLPASGREGELGNLAVNFKVLLTSRENFALTGGVAVNCPTGEDLRMEQDFDEPDLVIYDSPFVSSVAPTSVFFNGVFHNETVNLVPFVAWQVRPTGRFFHQGFLQIDAPLNRADADIAVAGEITPSSDLSAASFNVSGRGEIDQQTLLRLNLNFGYWLSRGGGGLLDGLAGLFEVHYTATLDNANPLVVPLGRLTATNPAVDDVPLNLIAGPLTNDVNQVNLSAGLAAFVGGFQVTNGVVVPVTDAANRSFNFEYSLQVNRPF